MKEIVQTYDQHLGPVNTLTFVDENRRFLSTSDDKSIRGWDWDIPVVIKYIAEPYMHSMPAVTPHPNGASAILPCMTSSHSSKADVQANSSPASLWTIKSSYTLPTARSVK
jgi:WD40 repeat protein